MINYYIVGSESWGCFGTLGAKASVSTVLIPDEDLDLDEIGGTISWACVLELVNSNWL